MALDVRGSIGATPIGGEAGSGTDELLRLLSLRPSWWADAACIDFPLDWWFPDRSAERQADAVRAKAICSRCNVRDECADYADSNAVTRAHGIWAGETARSRKRTRRGRAA